MKKLCLMAVFVLCISLFSGCGNNLLGAKPSSSAAPQDGGVTVKDPERFGRYIKDDRVMGLFVAKNDKEIKMKYRGEILSFIIPKDYNMKLLPEEIEQDEVVIITFEEKDNARYLVEIEIVVSMLDKDENYGD